MIDILVTCCEPDSQRGVRGRYRHVSSIQAVQCDFVVKAFSALQLNDLPVRGQVTSAMAKTCLTSSVFN